MKQMINDFIHMSKYAGEREDLVQAGGGNSSVKLNASEMLIKTSGIHLSDMSIGKGYSRIDYSYLRNALKDSSIDSDSERELLQACLLEGNRPSIETFLHALTRKYTLHTHPLAVSILVTRKDGFKELRGLFPDALFVDYATPGVKLAELFCSEYNNYSAENQIEVIFLKNHGLIVSADIADAVVSETENVLKKIESYLSLDMGGYHAAYTIHEEFCKAGEYEGIIYLVKDKDVAKNLGAFKKRNYEFWVSPDSIVFCGKRALIIERDVDKALIKKHRAMYGEPVIIIYQKDVYINAPNMKKAKEIECVLSYTMQIVVGSNYELIDYLGDTEQNFLLNWDSEKYRKNL